MTSEMIWMSNNGTQLRNRYNVIFSELVLVFWNQFKNDLMQCKAYNFLFLSTIYSSFSKWHILFKHWNCSFDVMQNFSWKCWFVVKNSWCLSFNRFNQPILDICCIFQVRYIKLNSNYVYKKHSKFYDLVWNSFHAFALRINLIFHLQNLKVDKCISHHLCTLICKLFEVA